MIDRSRGGAITSFFAPSSVDREENPSHHLCETRRMGDSQRIRSRSLVYLSISRSDYTTHLSLRERVESIIRRRSISFFHQRRSRCSSINEGSVDRRLFPHTLPLSNCTLVFILPSAASLTTRSHLTAGTVTFRHSPTVHVRLFLFSHSTHRYV